jgi:hypothetical protein
LTIASDGRPGHEQLALPSQRTDGGLAEMASDQVRRGAGGSFWVSVGRAPDSPVTAGSP